MKFSFTLLLLLSMQLVFGQSMTYESRILDVSGIPIPGATVTELGTSNVAISDQDGRFRISSSKQNLTLRISFIGFETQDVVINDGVLKKEIKLLESTESLEEFVVTALGVERQRQSLSSAVTTIGARELSDVPQTNLINSLSGQVAGVQITNGSSGVGSSSRIIIRGENSISGNNQALIVIDGVPIINEQITSDLFNDGANIQEVDFGNGAAEINPDDIESITILKGPGSAALYGARAANGVVLITTKKGRKKQGIGVTTSSLLTFDGLLTLPDYQNEYGGGSNGQYSFQNGIGAGVNA
ncbi:MAG TPA: SusC/RagA family TonB-linked outer membrane protein, partial [Algoriphagus sp.]|nr:SusC/RagA family TonB-linked outer membrane protein [Algoriphagus sp.]